MNGLNTLFYSHFYNNVFFTDLMTAGSSGSDEQEF